MDYLLSTPGLRTDYVHFSAITTAAAHIWTEAQRSPRFRGHADVSRRLEGLYPRCLQDLQPMLALMGTQAISNILWSSAALSFNPDDAVPGMVHALTSRFPRFIDAEQEKQRPKAQAVANLVWAFGTLKHTPYDDRLLDQLCDHMQKLLGSCDQRTRPNAQNIANMLLALVQLRHLPSDDVVTAMSDHLVALCHTPGLQPNSQSISNSFIAFAELRLGVSSDYVEALLKHLLDMHVSSVSYQHYCNAAWSLAVVQCLDLDTFGALLDKLTTENKVVEQFGPQSTAPQMTTANIRQLYQALAWLRPSPGSKQMKAWSSLQSRLLTVAPEPAVRKLSIPGRDVMWAALAMQEVPYKAQVQRGVYQADALLSPREGGGAEVILMVEAPGDHLINSSRFVGSAAFRNQLLARYGTVVTIPYNPDSSTAESMADDIKAAVEAKTGLPLDSFRS